MSVEGKDIPLRDARDRLAELLGLGEPHPLRDLPAGIDGHTVAPGEPASIPIELSQTSVVYALHDVREDEILDPGTGEPIEAAGVGTTLNLRTPPIDEDITFKIHARKPTTSRAAYLHAEASVKVGLDTSLQAWIRSHGVLDPNIDTPQPADARLADFGDVIEVEIAESQEGVDYELIFIADGDTDSAVISTGPVLGTSNNIVLASTAVTTDGVVRVRASRDYETATGSERRSELLAIELPLKVRADPSPLTSAGPSPIVDFATQASVLVAATQTSAVYRVHVHRVKDTEYVHDPAPDDAVLRVALTDEPEVQIVRPALPDPWEALDEFTAQGEFIAGTGAALSLPLELDSMDSVVLVEARKNHQDGTRTIPSSVWLTLPVVVLYRPDPGPQSLQLTFVMADGSTDGTMLVRGGTAGVRYYFQPEGGDEFAWPAYFHRTDAEEPALNHGIGLVEEGLEQGTEVGMEVEIDFVIARDPPTPVDPAQRPRTPPLPPLLDTGALGVDTTLTGRAMTAQTGLQAPLTRAAALFAAPDVAAQSPTVASGESATINVTTSLAGHTYRLLLDGEPVGDPVAGNGAALAFTTPALESDTTFAVEVTRSAETGLRVAQLVEVAVTVSGD